MKTLVSRFGISMLLIAAVSACGLVRGPAPGGEAENDATPSMQDLGKQQTDVPPSESPRVHQQCLAGNWLGDGVDRPGLARPDSAGAKEWFLSATESEIVQPFSFGLASDRGVSGDFDGDGMDTVGVFRKGVWYVRNQNADGAADIEWTFGLEGDYPVVGDWNGDGVDTPGVFRNGVWYLTNTEGGAEAEIEVNFGVAGDTPIVGDFDHDGVDTIGVVRSGRFMLRNDNSSGEADIELSFAMPTDVPVAGDWDGDGQDTIGVIRDGMLLLRNSNDEGEADLIIPCLPAN